MKRKKHLKLRRIHYWRPKKNVSPAAALARFRRKYECFCSDGFGAEISLKRKNHVKLRRIHYCGHNKDEFTSGRGGAFRRKYECFCSNGFGADLKPNAAQGLSGGPPPASGFPGAFWRTASCLCFGCQKLSRRPVVAKTTEHNQNRHFLTTAHTRIFSSAFFQKADFKPNASEMLPKCFPKCFQMP